LESTSAALIETLRALIVAGKDVDLQGVANAGQGV
jgi:hypothetical protein